jgi:hypothetical protein
MQATLMAVFALGLWVAMGSGMIFAAFGRLAERLPSWMAKPLASCPRCMCGMWGIAALFLFGFDLGVDLALFGPEIMVDPSGNFVPVPLISFSFARIAEVLALVVAAVGVQEILQK